MATSAFDLVADILYPLPDPEIDEYSWTVCGREECDGKPHEGLERKHLRPNQVPPDGNWLIHLWLAGRGFGKNFSASNWLKEKGIGFPGARIALVGNTLDDIRDTIVEGDSGLLSIIPPKLLRGGSRDKAWNRSMAELFLANGTKYKGFSSETPDKLRGPQHHFGFVDEIATLADANRGPEEESTTISNLLLGLRLGPNPQLVITGTPKKRRVLVGYGIEGESDYKPGLLKMPGVVITKGTTYENLDNLAPTFKARILDMYEGTRTGQQELMAEILDDVEGALWLQKWIDDQRETHRIIDGLGLIKVVIGVDPATTSGPNSDETGIVIAGIDGMRHGYVLGDRSCRVSPRQWALRIVQAYHEYGADYVVCEKTAGDLLVENLEAVDATMPVRYVSAKVGKRLRATPIANLYEKGIIHHISNFKHDWESLGRLEDQMVSWVPDETPDSPDRVDALAYSLSALLINGFLQPSGPTTVKDKRLAGRR